MCLAFPVIGKIYGKTYRNQVREMDDWDTKVLTKEVVKFNAHNTYIEVFLKCSKKISVRGQTEVKVECMTKTFQMINNNKVYKNEENFSVNTYQIEGGKFKFLRGQFHIYQSGIYIQFFAIFHTFVN